MLLSERRWVVERLAAVPSLARRVEDRDAEATRAVLRWLEVPPTGILAHSPLAASLAVQRGRLALAGSLARDAGPRERSSVTIRRATWAAIEEATRLLEARRDEIDEVIDPLRERLVQLVVVAAAAGPIPLAQDGGVASTWAHLASVPSGAALASLVAASTAPDDRLALLAQVLDRFLSGTEAPRPEAAPDDAGGGGPGWTFR